MANNVHLEKNNMPNQAGYENQVFNIPPEMLLPMVTQKKLWRKPTDEMDTWLDTKGFYRKHIARDASSLFRCVSEELFYSQFYHENIRRCCLLFAMANPDVVQCFSDGSIDDYVNRIQNNKEPGSVADMKIISIIFKLDFMLYQEIDLPPEQVSANNDRSLVLSVTNENHYDSVHTKQYISNSAFCQLNAPKLLPKCERGCSIRNNLIHDLYKYKKMMKNEKHTSQHRALLYEMLYKNVFKLEEVDYAVDKMLHDKISRYHREFNAAFFNTGLQTRLEMRDTCKNVKNLLDSGITPFPYKVAKSLDPTIYRNVEYDAWNEHRKNIRYLVPTWNNRELQIGAKCLVNLQDECGFIKRHGYIQEMSPDKGPVVLFVEELGQKITVPFECLELLPMEEEENQCENDYEQRTHESSDGAKENGDAVVDSNKGVIYSKNQRNVEASSGNKIQHLEPPPLCSLPLPTHLPPPPVMQQSTSTCFACISERMYSQPNDEPFLIDQKFQRRSVGNFQAPPHRESVFSPPAPCQPRYPYIAQDANTPPQTFQAVKGYQSNVRILYNYGNENFVKTSPTPSYYVMAPNYVMPTTVDQTFHTFPPTERAYTSPIPYPIPPPPPPADIAYAVPANAPAPPPIIIPPAFKKMAVRSANDGLELVNNTDTRFVSVKEVLGPMLPISGPPPPSALYPVYYTCTEPCCNPAYPEVAYVEPSYRPQPVYSNEVYQLNPPAAAVCCQPVLSE